jgi:hypothetical protein
MKKLEELVCSWQQGKRLVELNINAESLFKWVHPYQPYKFTENKRKYILVESYRIANRSAYPAYSIEELLNQLPDEYILGRIDNEWYCKSFSESWSDVMYYAHPILACVYAAIFIAEVKTCKAEENKTEEKEDGVEEK